MQTGPCGLLGTTLLLFIDIVWSFSGPMGWGTNGECGVGNAQLQMIATIVRKENGTTSEWSVPESATVTCANVSGSTGEFKIRVKWSWEDEAVTTPLMPSSIQSTTAPDASIQPTQADSPAITSTTVAPTQADTKPTTPQAVLKEKRDSDTLFLGKDLESSTQSEPGTSASRESDENSSETTQADVPSVGISGPTPESSTSTDVRTGTSTDDRTSTDVSLSTESSTSTTDVSLSTHIPGIKGINKQLPDADETTSASTLPDIVTQPLKPKSILERFQKPPEIILSCYPSCGSEEDTAWVRFEGKQRNLLTFTVSKSDSLFRVTGIYLRYVSPKASSETHDKKDVYRVYWNNVKLFPGPLGTTHVCETPTKLPLNFGATLVLHSAKLAAFLPPDHSEFPESNADCNSKYEEEEENRFCKTAEIIMITVGAVVGSLLLSGLCFYICKLYRQSKREREARDTLP